MTEYNHGFKVLYVDDEPQALKMFEMAYRDTFPIVTAQSAQEGWEVIQGAADEIGVLITDQRMPGESGVDLMQKVQVQYPQIVRILTTAYSDLDCAINAVNVGGAFAYVTKPWEIDGLLGTLKRGMEFFAIRWERDRLLREKVSSVQRMLVMDRVRGLTTLASAVSGFLRNSLRAVMSYVEQANLARVVHHLRDDIQELDLMQAAREECEIIVTAARRITRELCRPEFLPNSPTSLGDVIDEYIVDHREEKLNDGISFLNATEELNQTCVVNGELLKKAIDIFVNRICDMDGEDRVIAIEARPASPSKRMLSIMCPSAAWSDGQVNSLYSAVIPLHDWPMGLDMDILSAFFIIHHFGGEVEVVKESAHGAGFVVSLAVDEAGDLFQEMGRDWLDRVFRQAELWRNID
jgi:two-component system, probable response regulator PhcQ